MKRFHWRAWLVASAIFILGFAAGGAVMVWFGARVLRETLRSPASEPGRADRTAARIGADLTEELRLTPEESARVQAVLAQSAAAMKAIRADAAQRAAVELRVSNSRIAAELPPEKRAEFYRLSQRRYERLGLTPPAPPQPNGK